MFAIFYDKQKTGYSVKYTEDNGREKRRFLGKCDKQNAPPPEVVQAAERYRPRHFVPNPVPQLPIPTPQLSDKNPRTNLRAYCDRYLATRTTDMRPRSIITLRGVLTNICDFANRQGIHTLEEVSPMFVTDWTNDRLKTVQKYTALTQLALASGMLNMAEDEGIISQNPITKRQRKRLHERRTQPTRYLTDQQIAKLVNAMNELTHARQMKPQYRDAALVLLGTGMRVDAAIHIEVSWIEGDKLHVPPKWDKAKCGYTLKILDPALKVVQRLVKEHKTGRIFPMIRTANRVHFNIRRVCQKCGFGDILEMGRFSHSLRHTHGTKLSGQGVPLQVIQRQLGHRNIQTTMRYAKVTDDAMDKALDGHKIS